MVDKQTGDSAATAVAMFTGVKTNYKTLGYDSKVARGKWSTHQTAEKLSGILSWAQEAGMRTGFVTNSREKIQYKIYIYWQNIICTSFSLHGFIVYPRLFA